MLRLLMLTLCVLFAPQAHATDQNTPPTIGWTLSSSVDFVQPVTSALPNNVCIQNLDWGEDAANAYQRGDAYRRPGTAARAPAWKIATKTNLWTGKPGPTTLPTRMRDWRHEAIRDFANELQLCADTDHPFSTANNEHLRKAGEVLITIRERAETLRKHGRMTSSIGGLITGASTAVVIGLYRGDFLVSEDALILGGSLLFLDLVVSWEKFVRRLNFFKLERWEAVYVFNREMGEALRSWQQLEALSKHTAEEIERLHTRCFEQRWAEEIPVEDLRTSALEAKTACTALHEIWVSPYTMNAKDHADYLSEVTLRKNVLSDEAWSTLLKMFTSCRTAKGDDTYLELQGISEDCTREIRYRSGPGPVRDESYSSFSAYCGPNTAGLAAHFGDIQRCTERFNLNAQSRFYISALRRARDEMEPRLLELEH